MTQFGRQPTCVGKWIKWRDRKRKGGGDGDDGDDDNDHFSSSLQQRQIGRVQPTASLVLPQLARLSLRFLFGTTIVLYVLNQKHQLPKPISSIVSRALFWPTLPLTVVSRIGKWTSVIDDTVIIGGAPFGFARIPERLYEDYGVVGVINLCDEYRGPTAKYDALGIQHLWLRTVDHFEPSVADLKKAVTFIQDIESRGEGRVYVHCRAGHGRSAAVVFAWLMYNDPDVEPERLNAWLCLKRNVRKTLWKQPNIRAFRYSLRKSERKALDSSKGMLADEGGTNDHTTASSNCDSEEETDMGHDGVATSEVEQF